MSSPDRAKELAIVPIFITVELSVAVAEGILASLINFWYVD